MKTSALKDHNSVNEAETEALALVAEKEKKNNFFPKGT